MDGSADVCVCGGGGGGKKRRRVERCPSEGGPRTDPTGWWWSQEADCVVVSLAASSVGCLNSSVCMQPIVKASPLVKILPNITGLRTDEEYDTFLFKMRKEILVVNFGSSWCTHCHDMFPHVISLSTMFDSMKFAVAQLDYMSTSGKGIEYTPTFVLYKKGKKVDQFYGANAQQLHDHLWLHCDRSKED